MTKEKIASWIATCGPIGHFKKAPGTFGSLAGVAFVLIFGVTPAGLIIFSIFLFIVAVWASGEVARAANNHDPQIVVIDEVCGIIFTFLLIAPDWGRLAVGFICFRVFDIVKPFPLRKLEQFPSGFGIVLDDVGAGIYANIILQILIRYANL